MTELLNPAQTDPARPVTPKTANTVDRVVSPAGGTGDLQALNARAATQNSDSALFADALSDDDIRGLSTRHLRVLANQAYTLMDTDYPPTSAVEGYEMIVKELDVRVQQAMDRGPVHPPRETFRDNPLYGRFELLIDGTLAVYVKYTMTGGQLVLIDGMEQPAFRDQGMDMTLMRHVVLNTHKRRLSLIPQCPMAFSFFADHPQYQALTARTTH